jgi:histidinol-phosphate aminotransferase
MTMAEDSATPRGYPVQPRLGVEAIAPYVPGRSIEEVKHDYGLNDVVKLASNENPFGPSPRAVEAAAAALGGVHRYPDGASRDLRAALARHHGLERENVIMGNGSDEVITLLALAYLDEGSEAVLAVPPYSVHRTAVLVGYGKIVSVPLRHYTHDLAAMAAAVTERVRLIMVANPHNPTGTAVTEDDLRRLAAVAPERVVIIVDEAYYDFVDDDLRFTARDLLDRYPNVVTVRTFSKVHGLPGLRAGYGLAHPDIVSTLDRIRPPFGLNSVAQVAALAALSDSEYLARVVAQTREGRSRLLEIARRRGLEAIPSQANFVLMRVGDSTVFTESLLRLGVIVRPGEDLSMPGWVRVSVGTPEELDRFDAALDRVAVETQQRVWGSDG